MIKIVSAVKNLRYFILAEKYVASQEQIYCSLMERIQKKDSSVYVIVNRNFISCEILGVVSFTKGRSLTACINDYSDEVVEVLKAFLADRNVFSIIGEAKGVEQLEKIILETKGLKCDESRQMYLMKFNAEKENQLAGKENPVINKCKRTDEEELFPLQCAYSRQEVLPSWQEQNLALERFNFAMTLKNHYIFAVMENDKIVSKVQSNAITRKFIQIGGVFTKEECRGKSYASFLVNYAAKFALNQNKQCVLFVRTANESALHAYKKAGFEIVDDYKMVYYKA